MLEILHEDDWLLAVAKPAGVSTQAPPIAGETLEMTVRAYLERSGGPGTFAGPVHRLDRPVSGVVMWAKTRESARLLARQFEQRTVNKEYWGVVEGRPDPGEGTWEDWLVREETGLGRVQCCRVGTPRSQFARTRYRARGRSSIGEDWWAVELRPETGRMHQLRAQLGARGLPIVGDALYGARGEFGAGAIVLHARAVTVRHPGTGHPVRLEAPLPKEWRQRGAETWAENGD
jgi:23S rRNA pseudouridine1911/1915/1917 synthase